MPNPENTANHGAFGNSSFKNAKEKILIEKKCIFEK